MQLRIAALTFAIACVQYQGCGVKTLPNNRTFRYSDFRRIKPQTVESGDGKLETSSVPVVQVRGMKNLGGSSYFNSLWQVLTHIRPFQAHVQSLPKAARATPPSKFLAAARGVVGELWKDKQPPMDTTKYFESFAVYDTERITSATEIDVLEAFEYLNTNLRAETVRMQQGKPYDVFETKYASYCGASEESAVPPSSEKVKDSFLRLPVPAEPDGTFPLGDLIKRYFTDSEACPEGTRATRLLTPPRILALALDADRAGPKVTLPGDLDLSEAMTWSKRSVTYRLVGAVFREETQEGEPHYVADYYNAKHKTWFHTDDEETYAVEGPPENSPIVRMLFYIRTN